ncbi:BglII/BstYI family type II restriction endonuclease [Priestia megaterium]|uniref:BglII/BstYI family type II restriction endonuclease n=1 Tax=Priestia megaterium TaxID=1404 RepID=UPI003008BE83
MLKSEKWIYDNYEVASFKGGLTILKNDYSKEWHNIKLALRYFRLLRSEVMVGGKNKSLITKRIEKPFLAKGWVEVKARTHYKTEVGTGLNTKKEKIIDTAVKDGTTHKIDLYKNKVGIEVEWNSKDGVFSRDLEAFRLLNDMDAIHVGVIITRSSNLQTSFNALGVGKKYGASTTHMNKVTERIKSSVTGCPIVVFGITDTLFR